MQRQATKLANPQHPAGALEILVVDDHAIVREGLKRILDGNGEGWHVCEADSGLAALGALRSGRAFDVAIVDLSMPGMNGLDFLRRARTEAPLLRVLVLSMHDEDQYAMRAFRAGAKGYVTKDSAAQELSAAVRKVAGGGSYVSSQLAERMVMLMSSGQEPERHAHLSDREIDVLRRLVAGQRPTDIARQLHLSVKTVSTHKSRILERLQLSNLAALVRYGMEHGLATEAPLAPEEP
jgi:DNA-binding NarL/FixJ family response regulator